MHLPHVYLYTTPDTKSKGRRSLKWKWKWKYVDDIFVLFESAEHLSKFRDYFNTRHSNMSFSFEPEKNGKLSFLDVEVSREKGKFVTTVYRKPTFSDVYTHFESFLPTVYKFGMVYTLVYRCFEICSDWTKFHEELSFLKQVFLKNGYPLSFIDNCFKTFVDKLFIKRPQLATVEKKTLFLSLPYLGEISLQTRTKLDKACFVHDAAYSDSKDLTKRTVADKILKNKAFDIAKDPKYDGYQRGLASMIYKFFDSKVASPDKKSVGSGAKRVNTKNTPQNEQLAEELHKPIIRKFKKRKVYSTFKDNIWGADLADMQLLSKYNKGIRFLLCVIDIFSKYAWVVPLKDKKGISIVKAFQSILK